MTLHMTILNCPCIKRCCIIPLNGEENYLYPTQTHMDWLGINLSHVLINDRINLCNS